MDMKTKIQQQPNQSKLPGSVACLNHFLKHGWGLAARSWFLGVILQDICMTSPPPAPPGLAGCLLCSFPKGGQAVLWVPMKRSHWLGAPSPCLGCPHRPSPGKHILGTALLPSQNRVVALEETKSCPFWLQEFLAWKGDLWEAVLPQRSLGDIV